MRTLDLAAAAFFVECALAAGCVAQTSPMPASGSSGVSAVRGPSVLTRLHLSIDDTSFGKLGGDGPARPAREEPMPRDHGRSGPGGGMFAWMFRRTAGTSDAAASEPFTIAGADLYRMSCQSCHGPDGQGSAPEINSLVGPVRGTSLALLVQQMREHDRPVDESFLRGVAEGAGADLRQRLREGGQKMPSFTYLSAPEVGALVGYLQRMVDIPDAPASDPPLTISAARAGEDVVKGTCHVCHDATGPGRHAMMMQGATPSLAAMATEETLEGLVAKVREGITPPMMGMMMSGGASKMPKLPYLTPQELAAAMRYLRAYPPEG
jgi:mono/diheme cytochrome c family protein